MFQPSLVHFIQVSAIPFCCFRVWTLLALFVYLRRRFLLATQLDKFANTP